MTEENNAYKKGKSSADHLKSIFVDPHVTLEKPLQIPNPDPVGGRTALLSGDVSILEISLDDPDTDDVDESSTVVINRGRDLEHLKTYWGCSATKDVNLSYEDAPDFTAASSRPAFLKSPFCPNLITPRIDGALVRGAFTATSDNTTKFALPDGADPSSVDRFGTRRGVSNRNNGSLKSPQDFVSDIKANAVNPPALG